MTRRVGAVAVLIALTAASAGAIAATNRGGANGRAATAAPEPTAQAAKKPIEFDANDLFIETNQTDGDAGLQMKLDGEKWRQLKVHDPKGRKVMMEAKGKGRLRNWGLTELFFETDEPPFDNFPFSKFKKRFPEGKYTFTGRTVGGRKMVGSDRFSHLVPDGPVVTSPTEGEQGRPERLHRELGARHDAGWGRDRPVHRRRDPGGPGARAEHGPAPRRHQREHSRSVPQPQ